MSQTELTVIERGWLSSNNIVIDDGAGGAVVVDTGYSTHAQQTLALLQQTLQGRPLTKIINTHLHSDHCGGNALLAQHFAAPVLIPPGQFEAARVWNEELLSYRRTGQTCDRFQPDQMLEPGSTLRLGRGLWHVLAAPGHDPDSVLLFESNHGTLISADALWERGFGIVFPELDGDSGFAEVEATLNLIASLPVSRVIPGHGGAFSDVKTALSEARRRLQNFRNDPIRHARYAAKALVKFHLIEVREQRLADLQSWLAGTDIHTRLWSRYFSQMPIQQWTLQVLDELRSGGALTLEGTLVRDAVASSP
ncbi:MAG TPA: MBL fold metallo-hydrolase [Gammaproteobacteria bacterium]|nr:MBL fold metallo-hydrolase [Gammaproteobacteria bacterium]